MKKSSASARAKPSVKNSAKPPKKKMKFTLLFKFTMLVMADILLVFAVFWLVSFLSRLAFKYTVDISLGVWFLILSTTIGSVVAYFIGKDFLSPINKLSEAMSKVAKGDFSIRLNDKSSYREIEDINSNFNLMTTELGATEVLQTDFVSNVSHEFKTPISAIEGYATLLQDSPEASQEQLEYIEKILFNAKRLSNLVGNILLLSKVDNQVIQSKNVKYRLDEQIRQSIIMLEPDWETKNIEFDVEMESIEYVGARELLMHVWNNLIGNAIKFDPVGGIIMIRLFRNKDGIVFTVEDNGPGISAEAQKHIFDKFYQEDSSHKEEGNGLGLALVKRILAICQGEISVENISPNGCRFTVKLSE